MPLGIANHRLNLAQPSGPPPANVASMSFVGRTEVTGTTVTLPAGSAAGDFAILFDSATTGTTASPTSWVSVNTISSGIALSQVISYRILQSGDIGSTFTGMATNGRKVLIVYRPNTAITTVSVTVTGSEATIATPASQSLVGQAGPMIAFACYSSSGNVATRGWSVGAPSEYFIASTSSNYVKALITNTGTPATTTISMNDAGTNALTSFRVRFT
jgi:hypothetical protein